jgi:hypothetical protein
MILDCSTEARMTGSIKWSCAIVSVLLTGCAEPVRIAEHESVRVADDSQEIRKVIFNERDLQVSERRGRTRAEWLAIIHAENFEGREPARRKQFLKRLASAPGFDVGSASDARTLQTVTDCRCTLKEQYANTIEKIQITSGPYAGKVGWVCDDRIRRVMVWP